MSAPGLLSRMASWAVRNRERLPASVNALIDRVAKNPDSRLSRLVSRLLGGTSARNVPPPSALPDAPIRVYIGPTNYAGQGQLWARALENEDARIGARNLAVDIPGGFAFPADALVPLSVYNSSKPWQQAELEVVERFTHVLFEAERPLFGSLFGRDVRSELEELQSHGLSCAFLSHGTDSRHPGRHMEQHRWSPYLDDRQSDALQSDAEANLALLASAGRPIFVSTPDLLDDLPNAHWCPVVVDAPRWSSGRETFAGGPPRVVHVPSMGPTKGTHLVEPTLLRLAAEGLIEYRAVRGVASAQMPELIGEADIVLDQFRIGSYGAAACEAMAAGRVVIGHVSESVRTRVDALSGRRLPIVEADPETLEEVLRSIVQDPGPSAAVAEQGPGFVKAVHSGPFSARALIDYWIAVP